MKSAIAVAAVTVLLFGSSAFGSLTISADAPAGNIAVAQTTQFDSSSLAWRNEQGEHYYAGQTFTATADTIDKVSLLINQAPDADRLTAGMAMRLTLWDANNNVSATSGTILATDDVITPSFEKNTQLWWEFDLADTNVTIGNVYGITLDFQYSVGYYQSTPYGGHKLGDDSWGWRRTNAISGGDVLSGGEAFWMVNGVNYASGYDFAFVVQSVPEPATMALLGLGALGALIRRKK